MRSFLITVLVSVGAAAVACTGYGDEDDDPCIDTGTCASYADAGDAGDTVAPEDAGDAGAATDVAPDAGCDLAASPREAACVVDDANGVFVAPTGSDADGDGTRAKPLLTIQGAAERAAQKATPRVFVCTGAYAAPIAIGTNLGNLAIYGGFDCATWAYDAKNVTTVAPPSGVALDVREVSTSLLLEDLNFVAADAVTPGASSIAVQVTSSQHVTFRRVMITAGVGSDGKTDTSVPTALVNATVGNAAVAGVGGAEVSCPYPLGPSVGGRGGSSATNTATNGAIGAPGTTQNQGKWKSSDDTCSVGTKGDDAPPSSDGKGANVLGALSSAPRAWTPAAGMGGANGAPGQGGGGGGAVSGANGGGGGGGSGGCGGSGGAGGIAGGGGGASIGALLDSSDVSLESVSITSAKAGAGGNGTAGQDGAPGAVKGNGAGNGCAGGPGGAGAAGGAGGGGAGGLSAAIAFSGTAPKTDTATTLTPGTAGAAGKGGKPGTNDGIAGSAIPSFEIH